MLRAMIPLARGRENADSGVFLMKPRRVASTTKRSSLNSRTATMVATRSPARPNPLALTAVPVISIDIEAVVVRVPFIDAEDGTPILDLKPYHPAVDRIREVSVPQWCEGWPEWYEDSATFDWGAVFENAR